MAGWRTWIRRDGVQMFGCSFPDHSLSFHRVDKGWIWESFRFESADSLPAGEVTTTLPDGLEEALQEILNGYDELEEICK